MIMVIMQLNSTHLGYGMPRTAKCLMRRWLSGGMLAGSQGVNGGDVGHVLDLPHAMSVGLVEASRVEVLAHHR